MRLFVVLAFAAATASAQSCFDQDPYWNEYELDTEMSGATFFDHWDFSTTDYNVGAADYLDRNASIAAGVVEATDDYAILRVGARGNYLKRQSARLVSKKDWTYFLAAAHFTHVPMGCGVWPAWWTHCHTEGVIWPNGGELDILEHAGDLPGKVSFHTGAANDCTLSESVTNACPGVANFIDKNQCPIAGSCDMVSAVWGECYTDYSAAETHLPMELGCAPMKDGAGYAPPRASNSVVCTPHDPAADTPRALPLP